jgi:hypothetical protein
VVDPETVAQLPDQVSPSNRNPSQKCRPPTGATVSSMNRNSTHEFQARCSPNCTLRLFRGSQRTIRGEKPRQLGGVYGSGAKEN